MPGGKKYRMQNNTPQFMALPEEIFREIFYHLSNTTLYFSLRKVCRRMCHYVDRYIAERGMFFLVSWEKCRPNQIIDVIKTPSKRFRIDWQKNIWFPDGSDNLERTEYGCSRQCKDNALHYYLVDDSINCSVADGQKFQIYHYDILSNKWIVGAENCDALKRVYLDGKGWYNRNLKPNLIHRFNHCHPILLPEHFPDNYDGRSYHRGKNLFFPQITRGERNGQIDDTYEAQLCSNKIGLNKCLINRYMIQANLNENGYDIARTIYYMSDIPYRPRPLCFKLKESLYIAGSYPIWSKIQGWIGAEYGNLEHNNFYHNSGDDFKKADSISCDKFDLSNENYYPNICSLPAPLKYLTNLKVTTNKNESIAIIHFYDPIACRDKVWLFDELEERFEEHWDPNSKPCSTCQSITDDQDPNNSTALLLRMQNHLDYFRWNMRILNIH